MKTNTDNRKMIVCYGEVLWDIFPTQTKPGGAPMNVGYHLRKLGVDSHMISRVGADEWGNKILNLLDGWQIPAHYCAPDAMHETGLVHATAVTPTEMAYTIEYPAAWDFIEWNAEMESKVAQADAFVYGSLVTRDKTSRNTLLRLLDVAKYKVFDINLRPPFYDKQILEELMGKCNLLKMNENEVALLGRWYLGEDGGEDACVRYLQDKFDIDEVIVTKGEEGAAYYTRNSSYFMQAYQVEVKDTVGSGDSFLAAFLSKKLNGASAVEALKYAIAVGAFVASSEGACPAYSTEDLNRFIQKKQLEQNKEIISN
jgi:fructokinase